MKWQTIRPVAGRLLQTGLKTTPNRIVLLGLSVVLAYLVFWFGVLLLRSLHGSASGMLQLVAIGLGSYQLWKQRHVLETQPTPEEDQLLGQILTVSGALFFPVCLIMTWSDAMVSAMIMALVCVIILAGVACSLWGVGFFSTYPVSIFLICLGLLPKPAEITRALWQSFTAPEILERSMAWAGTAALQAIGQPAVLNGIYISLPNGTVQIGWGCNGFDMAITMMVASFVLGLFLKQSRLKIIGLMLVGAVLALVFNIPRIMLVTVAAVYWGKYWFDFWHDSWGSQIFVSVLFTIYYYVVMAIVKQRKRDPHPISVDQ
ncbi:cyanoexosortase C [Stenomitos frigidus]|uniref:Exosortase/archaeosortase family protein n=1 Tax=Stenomitos frigidus ULC18 TaxID=2107698 RepID=A0A2T1ESL2_9CYAN|nr:cyanoexosortase C [Stenomitos frigidus]PSB35727.1 exosortase/archaeosortase family protein [Stenomitos frigidus ULC18]